MRFLQSQIDETELGILNHASGFVANFRKNQVLDWNLKLAY
jgi:hypothetical protein